LGYVGLTVAMIARLGWAGLVVAEYRSMGAEAHVEVSLAWPAQRGRRPGPGLPERTARLYRSLGWVDAIKQRLMRSAASDESAGEASDGGDLADAGSEKEQCGTTSPGLWSSIDALVAPLLCYGLAIVWSLLYVLGAQAGSESPSESRDALVAQRQHSRKPEDCDCLFYPKFENPVRRVEGGIGEIRMAFLTPGGRYPGYHTRRKLTRIHGSSDCEGGSSQPTVARTVADAPMIPAAAAMDAAPAARAEPLSNPEGRWIQKWQVTGAGTSRIDGQDIVTVRTRRPHTGQPMDGVMATIILRLTPGASTMHRRDTSGEGISGAARLRPTLGDTAEIERSGDSRGYWSDQYLRRHG
ncbi:hypothetical protein FOZ63_001650, partial [Perkinsus olseni]